MEVIANFCLDFLSYFDIFLSHFLVKLLISNDRTVQIHRFCKRVSKSIRGLRTLSGRCFPLWSFRTHLLRLNSIGHSITITNIRVSNNLLSEVHCLLEGIHPGIRGTPPREGYLSISWENTFKMTEMQNRGYFWDFPSYYKSGVRDFDRIFIVK